MTTSFAFPVIPAKLRTLPGLLSHKVPSNRARSAILRFISTILSRLNPQPNRLNLLNLDVGMSLFLLSLLLYSISRFYGAGSLLFFCKLLSETLLLGRKKPGSQRFPHFFLLLLVECLLMYPVLSVMYFEEGKIVEKNAFTPLTRLKSAIWDKTTQL